MSLKLTVVDQSPVHGTSPASQAPQDSIRLAQACDQWGYYRYWVAEHHNSIQFANPCPEILIAAIAAQTQNMRIGSGGVMLTHYSSYKVAEVFRMLESLYPGRIDLGIGRAPGGNLLSTAALAAPHGPTAGDHFPRQANDLVGLLRNQLPQDHPYAELRALPDNNPCPQLWMLGSGGGSSTLAGQLGMGLAVARFIAPQACTPAIFENYEHHLRAAGHKGTPGKMLAIACICADTEEEARLIAGTAAWRKVTTQLGVKEPLKSPEEVQDAYQHLAPSQQALFDETIGSMTTGTPEQCREEIEQLATQFGVDEVALVAVTHSLEDRINSYRLLGKA